MTRCLVFAMFASISSVSIADFNVGDRVVVIKDHADLMDDGKVVATASLGIELRVGSVNGDWIWVRHGSAGWVTSESVVLLAEAVARLDDMIAQKPADANLYRARGSVKYTKADYAPALQDLTQAIRLNPSNSSYYSTRAIICESLGDRGKAMEDHDEAIRLDSKNSGAFVNRGIFQIKGNKIDNAIADFNSAIAINPKTVNAYFQRGRAFITLHDFDKGTEDLDTAIKLDPTDSTFYIERGRCYRLTKQYDKAQADFSEAIRLAPSSPLGYSDRGALAFGQQHDYQRAQQDLAKALELGPTDVSAHYLFGRFLASCLDTKYRNYEKAIEYATKACELNKWKDQFVIRSLADAYIARGRHNNAVNDLDKAQADFSEAIRVAPSYPEPYWSRGTLLAWKNRTYEPAKQDLAKAVELGSSDANCLMMYASFLARCPDEKYRNGEKAFEFATKACELSQWKNHFHIDTLATAYAECSDFANAIKYEEQAISVSPDFFKAELQKHLDQFRQGKPLRQ